MSNQISKAVGVLNEGGIIIYPTDTAFGIGCRIDNPLAIERLFKIRNRPTTKATPVLVDSIEMAKKYTKKIPQGVEDLMNKYWPGGLTVVLPCKTDKVHPFVRGDTENIGLRIPDNQTALEVIKNIGVGLLGPSANFHGAKTPYEFKDLDPKLLSLVDYVLDGECKIKLPSTVLDCSKTPWMVLRTGAVSIII